MSLSSIDDQVMLHQHPAELLQAWLRFDTTNPPGNEAACVAYLDRLLKDSGVDTRIVARDPASAHDWRQVLIFSGQKLLSFQVIYQFSLNSRFSNM